MTGVEGELGEHLSLVLPLPLEEKTAVEWLAGLEQAVRFSLASRLTDCLGTLPLSLTGQPLSSEEATVKWIEDHVEQNILVALDIHWSGRLRQASSDNISTGLQAAWLVYMQGSGWSLYSYNPCSSQLKRSLENAVQLLLRQTTQQQREEEEEEDRKNAHLIAHILRSVIIYLRRKVDFAHSLMTASDVDTLWQLHIHYTTEQGSGVAETESVSGHSRSTVSRDSSANSSRVSMSGSRANLTSAGATSQLRLTSSPPQPSSLQPRSLQAAGSSGSLYSTPRPQLHISSPSPCTVHAGRSSVAYGFEYHGPTAQTVLTPSVEAGVVDLVNCIADYSFPGVSGGHGSQKTETVQVVAKVSIPTRIHTHTHTCTCTLYMYIHTHFLSHYTQLLGRHYFSYSCCHLKSAALLLHLVHTALSSGSILSLEDTHTLPTATQLRVRHYLNTLQPLLATSLITSTTEEPPLLPASQV